MIIYTFNHGKYFYRTTGSNYFFNPLRSLTIAILVLFHYSFSFAQVSTGSFWLMVSDTMAERSKESTFTIDSALNQLFATYSVTHYEKALPFANTPQLQKVYELRCNCIEDSLIAEIEQNFPNSFSGIKKLVEQDIVLYDPNDYMWYLTMQNPTNWLWHLKTIQADLAWNISKGDPQVKVAIIDTDFDITHPDLSTKINPHFDPFNPQILFNCMPMSSCITTPQAHGTHVAGLVAGETAEAGTTPLGQYASVGFNINMIGYRAWCLPPGDYLKRALHSSTVMGAQILTSSAGGWSSCPDPSGIEELIVKEILDNGTSVIMPAGNGENGTYNTCLTVDSINHTAFFPLSPYYDERIILVSGTDKNDFHHVVSTNGINKTHSHYPDVDLCAPGHDILVTGLTDCGNSTWPFVSQVSGTSFAAPIVAGIAGLMYSVNPCMTPSWCQDILKNTTDPIADAANFPGAVGTGRVNAFKAVRAAEEAKSTTLDLYIKDVDSDFGNETYPYNYLLDRDDSPDIWVRNQPDGFTNQTSQEPEYQNSTPVYVYVRIRNKSCQPSLGSEALKLYWTKSSTWSSWPQNWDGTDPNIGNIISSITIPQLDPGRETILEIPWNIPNPYIFQNWSTCLMARIENSVADPTTIHPYRLDDDVFYNNNIAMKNLTIVDLIPGVAPPGRTVQEYFIRMEHTCLLATLTIFRTLSTLNFLYLIA